MMGPRIGAPHKQAGFSYIEMLIATVIVLASLGPAIDSLQSASLAANAHEMETELHYRVMGRMEDVLAESFDALISAAAMAGSAADPSSYSDPAIDPDGVVVYLSYYDVANTDGDSDFFTIEDPDNDGDSNPYTGEGAAIEVAWVRAEIPGTTHAIETLSMR